MIKKAKKSVAVGLSVALAVTSVNIPVNSASAAAKKAKLSATKKTLTAGKSTTLTLKTNKKKAKTIKSIKAKYVKVSTSKKSVATVKKVSKKSKFTGIKVTAKKAGKSTITVKVTKGTYKGTYKCTVTVKKKASATKAPTQKPTEAPTATPEVTVEPTVEPTQAPTQEPTAEPATSPAISPDVQVKPAKIEGNVTNSLADYENTVLANQTATVKFKVTDADGNAVKNETVTTTLEGGTLYGIDGDKKVAVVTTDSEGIARVVVAPKTDLSDDTESAVGTYRLTASTSSDETVKTTVKISVAAIVYRAADEVASSRYAVKDVTNKDNKKAASNATSAEQVKETTNLAGGTVQYIANQQVSSTGEDHSVAFTSGVCIKLPGNKDKNDKASKEVQPINKTSGKYHTYVRGQWDEKGRVDVDFEIKDKDNVDYATLYFNNVSVSQYTSLEVVPYKYVNGEKVEKASLQKWNDYKTTNQGLQIAKDVLKDNDGVRIRIHSEGQVNTDQNDGFDVKDITYVYDTAKTTDVVVKPLKNTTITWESTTPVFSTEAKYTTTNTDIVDSSKGEHATYTVPVFPYVGNAVITVYNTNNEVIKYYSAPTENKYDVAKRAYTNVNVISGTPYLITKEEATNINPGTVKADGEKVTVDSTKSGAQYLKGTITSTDKNIVLDARNSEVYTSVMWNPIENKNVSDSSAFFALEGQNVDVIAQLVDKNGNSVTQKDVAIDFYDKSNVKLTAAADATTGRIIGNNYSTAYDTKGYTARATVTNLADKTDANGQVKMTLQANGAVDLVGLVAKAAANTNYNVVLVIGGTTVSQAEIHWAALTLGYTGSDSWSPSKDTSDNGVGEVEKEYQAYKVNQTWEIGTNVIAKIPNLAGKYADKSDLAFSVSGINTIVKAGDNSVGKVEASKTVNGMATVSSDKGGFGSVVNTLDKTSVSNDVKFTANYSDTSKSVGYGDSSVNEKLTVNYKFGDDTIQINNADVLSDIALDKVKRTTYFNVSTLFGNIPQSGRYVRFTLLVDDNKVSKTTSETKLSAVTAFDTAADANYKGATATDTVVTGKSNAKGIVGVDLTAQLVKANVNGTVKVKAELLNADGTDVDSSKAAVTKTYQVKGVTSKFGLDLAKTSYTNNSIVLTFNEEVLASSVDKKMFDVVYDVTGANKHHTADIDKVTVDGKKVTISYKNDIFANAFDETQISVEIKKDTDVQDNDVKYNLTSASGQSFDDTVTITRTTATDTKSAKIKEINDAVAAVFTALNEKDSTKFGTAATTALGADKNDILANVSLCSLLKNGDADVEAAITRLQSEASNFDADVTDIKAGPYSVATLQGAVTGNVKTLVDALTAAVKAKATNNSTVALEGSLKDSDIVAGKKIKYTVVSKDGNFKTTAEISITA